MDEDPISYPQAMKSKESSQWYEAMVKEMNSLKKKIELQNWSENQMAQKSWGTNGYIRRLVFLE